MSNRIVAGVEPTSAGTRVIAWSAQRARERELPLLLASVIGGPIGVVGEGELLAETSQQVRDWLEGEAEKLRADGLSVETILLQGDPVAQLTQTAAGENMLVIGSDYRGPESGPVRGIRGIRIVAASAIPVVVIPDHDLDDRNGVIVGVDGSPVSSAAIAFAAAEADRLREPLIAVSVWTPLTARPRNSLVYPDDYMQALERTAEETLALSLAGLRQDYPDLEIQTRALPGYPSAVINELAATATLAVVGSHGRGAIARFLLGSISHEVLTRLSTATAVVR
ncbi:universal stress protein [uncultured Microbacterium sp.]|uniref:universal stress protein n=1 Tax=uncultured Microbacterium sp. TaxID=191216 RepID=UPI00260899FF|nr:universal stress protein [uncultured Microbacterium sp.]